MHRARIIGTGSSVPEKVLSNKDLEIMVDTTDEWITTRSGIKERHICSDGESCSTFSFEAAVKALAMAGVSAEQLDLIIIGTVTSDMITPSTSCVLQHRLNAKNAFAFDVSAGCTGFIYSLSIAECFIKTDKCRNVLVVGCDTLSKITDYQDRGTCILFGDGAGAVVLTRDNGNRGILSTHLYSDGAFGNLLYMPAGGSFKPSSHETINSRDHYLKMDGNKVFKIAVKSLEEAACTALVHNKITGEDIDMLISHQANERIIDAIAKRLNLGPEKVFKNIQKYGNTSAGSVPIALDEANRLNAIKDDDLILLDAFGAGFTWGSALIRW